ncbi:unnamed protein product, partial [Laminaria digitata]
ESPSKSLAEGALCRRLSTATPSAAPTASGTSTTLRTWSATLTRARWTSAANSSATPPAAPAALSRSWTHRPPCVTPTRAT